MTSVDRSARYRAPTASGQKLIVPLWTEMSGVVDGNRQWRETTEIELLGRPLGEVTAQSRCELMTRARTYGASFGAISDPPQCDVTRPLIMTGHQPGLFHPGVWLKNFAAAALARMLGGAAAHVVIDADVCRSTAARTPSGTVDQPRMSAVEFDRPAAPLPWEERAILDEEGAWRSFPQRVREASSPLLADAMVDGWWPIVVARGNASGLIGASLSQARRLAEQDWGIRNLELPQNQLCQTAGFRWFACHLLANLPRFVADHNQALAEYRRSHRIRNHAHPAPNLAIHGEWLEAPLWMWSTADPSRRQVFARQHSAGVVLSDRLRFERLLPVGADGGQHALDVLAAWEAEGIKLRSRALLTTMFIRLVLADLFIHGIGGAKYDEATDAICRRFFGTLPPAYAALSGTLHLPIRHPPGDDATARYWLKLLRDYRFHPENHIRLAELPADQRANASALIAGKAAWINMPKTRQNAAERHAAISAANRGLEAVLANDYRSVEVELDRVVAHARANRILDSREYAFCLYPLPLLEQFLLDFESGAL